MMRTAITCTYYAYIVVGVCAVVLYVASLPLSLPLRAFSGIGSAEGTLLLAAPRDSVEQGAQVILPQQVPHASVHTVRGTAVQAGASYVLAEGGTSLRAREVYGHVLVGVPVLGYVLTFAHSIFGVVALFIAPLLMVVFAQVLAALDARRERADVTREYTSFAHV